MHKEKKLAGRTEYRQSGASFATAYAIRQIKDNLVDND